MKRSKAYSLYRESVSRLTMSEARESGLLEKRKIGTHIDHIVPVSWGFKNHVPFYLIGSCENLQIMDGQANLEKGQTLTDEGRAMLDVWADRYGLIHLRQ